MYWVAVAQTPVKCLSLNMSSPNGYKNFFYDIFLLTLYLDARRHSKNAGHICPRSSHNGRTSLRRLFLRISKEVSQKITSLFLGSQYVLSELRFTVPTVFQGWQTLSCVILLSSFIKFKKIKNDLQILDAKALSLLLPALVSFAVGIVAGSIALADLPVPVFLAVTNLYPALLVLFLKKNGSSSISLRVCGSTVILGTVTIILIYCTTSRIIWLLGHVFLNLFYYLYLNKLNLDLSNTTQIYYRNFFSVIFLFPVSLYLDVLHWPSGNLEFYVGCFLSGVLGTLLQVWTFKISTKSNYLQFEGLGKVLSSVIAHVTFFADIEPFMWVLIVLNFLVCASFLKNEEEKPANVKSDIILALPPPNLKQIDSTGISLV